MLNVIDRFLDKMIDKDIQKYREEGMNDLANELIATKMRAEKSRQWAKDKKLTLRNIKEWVARNKAGWR